MQVEKPKKSIFSRSLAVFASLLVVSAIALYAVICHNYYIAIAVLAIAVIAFAVMLIISLRQIRMTGAAVSELTYVARQISAGSFGIQASNSGDREIAELIRSVNEMSSKLSETDKMQGEFISSISHELRTPLTAITGWSETMQYDNAIQGDSRRGLMIIAKETSRLTKMVEDLLEFTRMQDGRFNLSLSNIDISAELEESIFTYSELLRQDGIELCYNPDYAEIPNVMADPERMRQVFLNILDNASKHGREAKKIDVTLSIIEAMVHISVHNFGPHIPEEELPRIKEKFYKGSSKERGSGIGLAVCDEIICKHGGALEIKNSYDSGVIVTIKLPLIDEANA